MLCKGAHSHKAVIPVCLSMSFLCCVPLSSILSNYLVINLQWKTLKKKKFTFM